jgi:hypothetical protein
MKPRKSFFAFPKYIPNDLEGFIFYYPVKYPKIIKYYEETAQKYFSDPEGFEIFCNKSYEELFEGFSKIAKDYQKGDRNDLNFLFDVTNRLHKLYAFRFWVINYIFADGPLHEYYVTRIRYYSRRIADIEVMGIEDYEARIHEIERDFIQSDYADLYLQSALASVELMEILRKDGKFEKSIEGVKSRINNKNNNSQVYKLLDPIIEEAIGEKSALGKKLRKLMHIPIEQAGWRKTKLPIYYMLMQSIEFEEKNMELEKRKESMKNRIDILLDLAKSSFSNKEFEELELCYKMARNLSKAKDVMGAIDDILLPFWIGDLNSRTIKALRAQGIKVPDRPLGPGAFTYFFVWYFPDEIKAKVFTIDPEPFDLKKA